MELLGLALLKNQKRQRKEQKKTNALLTELVRQNDPGYGKWTPGQPDRSKGRSRPFMVALGAVLVLGLLGLAGAITSDASTGNPILDQCVAQMKADEVSDPLGSCKEIHGVDP